MALDIRRADEDDVESIVALCTESLQWDPSHPNEQFFRWKHFENPFGPSYILLAFDGPVLVAVRAMMRWEFELDGVVHRAVRAVDTATKHSHRGRGLFRTLTLTAVADLTREGASFVFNTPNSKSMPGYLSMGWHEAGKVSLLVAPSSPARVPSLRFFRAPAEKFPKGAVEPPGANAITSPRMADRLSTRTTPDFKTWRYGSPILGYDQLTISPDHTAVIRRRRRGAATEVLVCELLGVPVGRVMAIRILQRAARLTSADYAVSAEGTFGIGARSWQLPGPSLTSRPLAWPHQLSAGDLQLTSGDIELF